MDAVFKALADPSRRVLLDRLFQQDGQTVTELTGQLGMTRYGVMKHLRLLERAHLITTKRAGRKKYHYLNPVPIRLLHDRWISKYSEAWARAMSELKMALETGTVNKPRHVFEIYIRTTPEKLWEAMTRPEFTRLYFHRTSIESSFEEGSKVAYRLPDGNLAVLGKVLVADPPRKLVTTWSFQYDEEMVRERPSRVTWEIEAAGDTCKLTLTHDDFDGETKTFHHVRGWSAILSSLKSLLETGAPLSLAGGGEASGS